MHPALVQELLNQCDEEPDNLPLLQHLLRRVDWTTDLHFQTRTTIDTLDYSGAGLNSGSKLVIAAALLEGPCFLALFAYLNEGHTASLAVAGICLLGILARFPTAGRLTDWLERQLQLIREEQQFFA